MLQEIFLPTALLVFLGLLAGLVFSLRRSSATERRYIDIQHKVTDLQNSLEDCPSKTHARILRGFDDQVGLLNSVILESRGTLEVMEREIYRHRKNRDELLRGGVAESLKLEEVALGRATAKRDFLKLHVQEVVQKKLGWIDARNLITTNDFAASVSLNARHKIEEELRRIDAGETELHERARLAIEETRSRVRLEAQRSDVAEKERQERRKRGSGP